MCSTLSAKTYKTISKERKNKWRCHQCKEENENERQDEDEDEEYDIKDIVTQLKKLRSDMKKEIGELTTKVSETIESLEFISKKYDDVIKTLNENDKKIDKVLNDVAEINKVKVENNQKIYNLERQINRLEQEAKNNSIEVRNIQAENCNQIKDCILEITKRINISIKENDITRITKINKYKSKNSCYLISFLSVEIADEILKNKKMLKQDEEYKNVYINPDLTIYNKNLLWEMKNMARQLKYKYVWTKRGSLYMREHENSKIVKINTFDDLNKLKLE